jgi:iron complex transport system substrate-binding protein
MAASDPSRRHVLAAGGGSLATLALAACGSSGRTGRGTTSAGTGAAVRHKYGTTRVPPRATRVVTLGYTDQEPVLALGVKPVGVVDFFGERPYGKWPWETTKWAGTQPQVVGQRDDFQFEKIAALRPDLILGLYSGMTSKDYATLSDIAPTVAQPAGHADFAAPWTVVADQAGRSLGRQSEAAALVRQVQTQAATVRAAHPEWKGKTVAVVEPNKRDQWAVFGAADPKLQFFESLGFTVAPAVHRIEPGGDVGKLSTERLDVLDVDRLVLLSDVSDQSRAQVEANPLYAGLAVARDKRATFLPFGQGSAIGAALAFNSVLSIPYGISHVVPALTPR